jgi:hypothetical protein
VKRRTWIGTGVAAALLAGVGVFYERPLQEDDAAILSAIGPVLLAGAMPEEDDTVSAFIANFQTAVRGLTPSVQDEVQQLFTLLRSAPLRMLSTGVMRPWQDAHPDDIARFLAAWRYSGIVKLRSAYDALHQLCLAAWYGDPQSWKRIGYPGPPVVKL